MRKLVLTAIAGSICAVFGSAYADNTVGNNDTIRLAQGSISGPKPVPQSEKGTPVPRSPNETRPDAISKGDKPMATPPAPAATPAPAPAMETDRAPRRRAARREKG